MDTAAILGHLDGLLKIQYESLLEWPQKPVDESRDWRAVNFLFRVGREYPWMSGTSQQQLDLIFWAWPSPEPLTLPGFTVMLRGLRESISCGSAVLTIVEAGALIQ